MAARSSLASGLTSNADFLGAVIEAEGGAGGVDVTLDVGAFEGDFVGLDVSRGDDGGNDGAKEERDGEDEQPAELSEQNGGGGDEASADFKPQQGQDDVLVDVIDPDEEAMIVAQESEAIQIETHGEKHEEEGDGGS